MKGNNCHNHRRRATQGMLHLIDTAPESASGSRQQQDAMIQQHLREHVYYKRSMDGPGQVVLRTEKDCKQHFMELVSECKLTRLKREKETAFDFLLRIRSSGLPKEVLWKYDYDLTTFDPASLPGPPPKSGDSNSRRADHHSSDQDDDVPIGFEDKDFVVPTASPIENDALLILPPVTTTQHALWTLLQDIDATSHLADHAEWKYRDDTTSHASLQLLIKQFSLVHRTRSGAISPYTAETLRTSLRGRFRVRKLSKRRQTFFDLYKLGSKAFAPTYVAQLKKSYETVIEKTDRPRYGSLPTYSTSAEVLAELNGDKVESIRLNEDNGDEGNSHSGQRIDHTSRSSSPTKASWHSAQSMCPNSASSEPNASLRKSTVTGNSKSVPVTPPRRSTPSPLATPAALISRPVISNLAGWESDLSNLSKRINTAVSSLFTNLSLPISQISPYLPSSALSLRSILTVCFGNEFQSACATLRDNDTFSAFNITQFLIAALLHERLLKERLDWQRVLCIKLGWSKIEDVQRLFTMLRDPLQNAIAREKLLPRRFAEAILKSVNDDHDRVVLLGFTKGLADQLISDLTPYIETLVQLASSLNQEEMHTNETWHQQFGENIATIITSAADLKLKLSSSEIEHCFFWPTAGGQFNVSTHKAINASGNSVAFTVMPGLRLTEGESTAILPAHVVCCSAPEGEET
ncbi:hypothetical protein AC579_7424 [Pseudocercospora musae]|uniref:Uncharacterized protein n=1 Tax=Pseudocercospora musae TaxID=113226 RepID=A0A139IQ77_9PEZI|nr:hypothetical protein AC579_7424 [Pseudocercospora musae]KXT16947.1 hypothetical protein AC579_7424 [Pseudocercospora musae]KXT16948.1 hypothetical protein AC579_7424 [Pseudocercospora musae]